MPRKVRKPKFPRVPLPRPQIPFRDRKKDPPRQPRHGPREAPALERYAET